MPFLSLYSYNYYLEHMKQTQPNLTGYYKPSLFQKLLIQIKSDHLYNKDYIWKNVLNKRELNDFEFNSNIDLKEKRIGRFKSNKFYTIPDTDNTFFRFRKFVLCALGLLYFNRLLYSSNSILVNNAITSIFHAHFILRVLFNVAVLSASYRYFANEYE